MLSASTIISSSLLPFLVLITTAVLGLRASRFFIDSEVVLSTLASRYSPIVNMVKTEADASKNIVALADESVINENILYEYATLVLNTTKVSVVKPFLSLRALKNLR